MIKDQIGTEESFNDDEISQLLRICEDNIKLIEAIRSQIDEKSSTATSPDELQIIEEDVLELLIGNDGFIKQKFDGIRFLIMFEDQQYQVEEMVRKLGEISCNDTFEGKVFELLQNCENNIKLLKAICTFTDAVSEIIALEFLIENEEIVKKKVEEILTDLHFDGTLNQNWDSSSHDEFDETSDDEEKVSFNIMYNHASSFISKHRYGEDDLDASAGDRDDILKFLDNITKNEEEEENRNLNDEDDVGGLHDEGIIGKMIELETNIVIHCVEPDGIRKDSFKFFVSMGKAFRFKNNTVYVAMQILLRFLEEKTISERDVMLLQGACLSIAAKMNQRMYQEVEELLEYFKSKDFNGKTIGKMECSILEALKWDIHRVTPFVFTSYFLSKFYRHYSTNESSKNYIRTKSEQIIMNVVAGGKLMKYKPSEIAAGATLLALDNNLTKESLQGLLLNELMQIDTLFSCYTALHELNNSSSQERFV